MDFLRRMNRVIDHIEAHLDEDMPLEPIARIAGCGAHQFGRIFAYVVGVPLFEYIRRRRLSQAAVELQQGAKVIDVALRYGYQSPDAFTRAFYRLHEVLPRDAQAPGATLRLYPRIAFHLTIKGDADMEYRIEKMDAIDCVGVARNFGPITANQEAKNWKDGRPAVWQFWENFLNQGENLIIRDRYKLYRAPFWQVGVSQTMENGDVVEKIGAQAREGEEYPELTRFTIPANTWLVVIARGTLNQDVHPVTIAMTRAITEWLPSSGYQLIENLHLEVYGPGDTKKDDYVSELWLPIRKAE